jgi:hypothetical protein
LSPVERPTYTARYENDGRFWFVRIIELERGRQAREFDEIERTATDLISMTLNVPADTFRVRLEEGIRLR